MEYLWETSREHGLSDHMLLSLWCIYNGQMGRIEDNNTIGIRFVSGGGVDFYDRMRALLDLRFANDFIIFSENV